MKAEAPGARAVAITVLHRVLDKGAFASLALDAEIARARLSPRDAALATEIVYGSLRVLPELEARVASHLTKSPQQMDRLARAALVAAAYQLFHLSRSPAHAVVDETVSFLRAKRSSKLGGFANAVLRKLAAERPDEPAPPTRLCVPSWVEECLLEALGPERVRALLSERPLPPPIGLRVEAGHTREEMRDALLSAAKDAEVAVSALSPLGLCARRLGSLRALPGYAQGVFSVQEEGAQLVALALGAQPAERIADLCAGHGGKTTLLARQVGPSGHVTAVDLDERKLERVVLELDRLGIERARVQTLAVDLSIGTGGLGPVFDRVLVDAPCTGLGTVHRRPELLLRLSASDPARMAELQLQILAQAVKLVRPQGLLCVAVCSASRAEGAELADRFEAAHPELRRVPDFPPAGLPRPDADGVLRIGPWLSAGHALCSPDVYQMVAFRLG